MTARTVPASSPMPRNSTRPCRRGERQCQAGEEREYEQPEAPESGRRELALDLVTAFHLPPDERPGEPGRSPQHHVPNNGGLPVSRVGEHPSVGTRHVRLVAVGAVEHAGDPVLQATEGTFLATRNCGGEGKGCCGSNMVPPQ